MKRFKGAARLHISPTFLGELLRLPEGQEVVKASITALGAVELLIHGTGLPACDAGGAASQVNLLFTEEVRQVKPPVIPTYPAFEYRLTACWEHDSTQRWRFRDWEPKYLTLATRG